MSESDFGKKTAAAEIGRHHDKQHRTSFGKTTSRRSSNQRTRAAHHSKNRHQKGTTFMKRKASATALVLFIVTLLLVTTTTSKAATFSTNDTLGGATTFTNLTSERITTNGETQFSPTVTAYTLDGVTSATSTGSQYFNSTIRTTVNTSSNQRWLMSNGFTGGTGRTATASTGEETKRFTSEQRGNTDFTLKGTSEFLDETNQGFNQFFF